MGTVQKEWKEEEACRSRPLFTYCSRINDIQGWVRFHSNARFRQPTISRGNNNFQLHSYYQWSFFFCGGYTTGHGDEQVARLKIQPMPKNIRRSTHTHIWWESIQSGCSSLLLTQHFAMEIALEKVTKKKYDAFALRDMLQLFSGGKKEGRQTAQKNFLSPIL